MEQTADHRTCQIHSLVADVVSVLLLVAIQRAVQQLVHHIAQVERLLAVAVGAEVHVDVRQHDLLKETARELDSFGSRPRSVLIDHFRMARRDEVQRFLPLIALAQTHLARSALRCLDERRPEPLHHLHIVEVLHARPAARPPYIADVLDDRSVVLAPQRAEENAHRDFIAQRGQLRPDAVFVFDLGLRGVRIHAEHEGLRRHAAPFWHASDLGRPGVFRRLLLFEHIDFVGGLALLGDDGLLAAVNDEITSLIIDTLAYAGTALIIETI